MSENLVRQTLYACREAVKQLPDLLASLTQATEYNQRLTVAYGKERVSSSSTGESPALLALIRHEEHVENIQAQITLMNEVIKQGKELVMSVQDASDRTLMIDYFINAAPASRLARRRNCDYSTIRRRISRIISTIPR